MTQQQTPQHQQSQATRINDLRMDGRLKYNKVELDEQLNAISTEPTTESTTNATSTTEP